MHVRRLFDVCPMWHSACTALTCVSRSSLQLTTATMTLEGLIAYSRVSERMSEG